MSSSGKRRGESKEKAAKVRITQTTYQKVIFKKIFSTLGLMLIVVIGFYAIFAATWIRVVPALSGPVVIKNNTFPGGLIPAGEVALISNEKIGTGIVDNLKNSFVPQKNVMKVEVLAGPIGEVVWAKSGVTTVDGKQISVKFPTDPSIIDNNPNTAGNLQNRYLAKCISGDCTPGDPIVFSPDNVYGIPLNKEDLNKDANFDRLVPGVERPLPEDIATWVRYEHQKLNQEQALCVAQAFYDNEEIPTELLSYAVEQSIKGENSSFYAEDSAKISEVYNSSLKPCGVENTGDKAEPKTKNKGGKN